MACFDTSFLLDINGRGGKLVQRRAQERLKAIVAKGELICTTRICIAELWRGVFRSGERLKEVERLQRVLADFIVLELTAAAAESFGKINSIMQQRGTPIGDLDTLIAAIAVQHSQSVITRNLDHFAAIPGLVVETY